MAAAGRIERALAAIPTAGFCQLQPAAPCSENIGLPPMR